MELSKLQFPKGARKGPKRVGRGEASGRGCTAGRGNKGQGARSGGNVKPGFEGGQLPLARRVPKSGFTNIFRKKIETINVQDLNRCDDKSTVDLDVIKKLGFVNKRYSGMIKVLAKGELKKSLTVKANLFSKAAVSAIEKAGGKAEVVKFSQSAKK